MKFSLALLATATSTGLASASADQILAFPPQRNLRSLSEGELGFSPDFLIDAYKKNAFNWEGIKTFLNGICEYYDNKPCWPEQETRRLLNVRLSCCFFERRKHVQYYLQTPLTPLTLHHTGG